MGFIEQPHGSPQWFLTFAFVLRFFFPAFLPYMVSTHGVNTTIHRRRTQRRSPSSSSFQNERFLGLLMHDSKKHDAPEGRITAPEAVMQSETERLSRMDKARGKRIVKPKWYWSAIHM